MKRTELSTIGEFGLIELIQKKNIVRNPETKVSIGDDAAVIEIGQGQEMLLSTDMMVEGIHFDLAYTPLKHLGFKAVASNVSDIAAMYGTPKQITVSLALSNRFSIEAVEELYEGIQSACDQYQVDLVGGDTTSSQKGLILSISVVGVVNTGEAVFRHTAKKGDILCVSGDLGGAFVGLQLLRREKEVYLVNPDMQPELSGNDYVISKQLKPAARMDLVHELKERGIKPTAMIDVSDGVASELMHICKKSGIGAVVYEDKLPLDNRTLASIAELNLNSTACMMNGGEDYELLFTIDQSDYDKIIKMSDVYVIGFMQEKEKGIKMVSTGGNVVDISAQGWSHF